MIASIGSLLKGTLAGAGLMYFFDPDRGRRRRAGLADQAMRATHDLERFCKIGCRDLTNRATGLAAETRRAVSVTPADDTVLVARVRSVLGHVVRNAHAVDVSALNGTVTLRGTVRPGEPEQLIPAIERLVGVRHVESGLITAGEPVSPPPVSTELTPGVRLLLTAGGGLLVLNGLARRGFGPTLLGTVGLGLFVQGMTDRPGALIGVGSKRGIDLRKSVRIGASVEKVYDFVSDIEQSGRLLPELLHVEPLGGGRVRWTLEGPAGIGRIVGEGGVIESVENERIVWGSADDSPIRYVKEALFQPDGDGTRLDVRITYEPPGGMVGHAAAAFFGIDPKTQLDRCLHRIKRSLEEGTVPRGVADDSVREHRG